MLLACAVLPEYQHAHVCWGHQSYPVHDFPEGGTVTGKHGHTVLPDTPFFQYGAEHGDEPVLDQLFGYIVQRAELHTLHRCIHFGIIGHDDERLHHPFFAHPAQ